VNLYALLIWGSAALALAGLVDALIARARRSL
jgi:hypothetical protein